MPPVRQKCAAKELNINVYLQIKGRQVISEGQRMRKRISQSYMQYVLHDLYQFLKCSIDISLSSLFMIVFGSKLITVKFDIL